MEYVNEAGEFFEAEKIIKDLIKVKDQMEKLKEQRASLEFMLAEMGKPIAEQMKTKTVRIDGGKFNAKVVYKERTKWLTKELEKAGEQYKAAFKKYFRVVEYAPNSVDYKKFATTVGDDRKIFEAFEKCKEVTPGKPEIEIEEAKK